MMFLDLGQRTQGPLMCQSSHPLSLFSDVLPPLAKINDPNISEKRAVAQQKLTDEYSVKQRKDYVVTSLPVIVISNKATIQLQEERHRFCCFSVTRRPLCSVFHCCAQAVQAHTKKFGFYCNLTDFHTFICISGR